MANEARVFAEGVGNPDSPATSRQFTVADALVIPKGTLIEYGAASRTGVLHTATLLQRPLGFATQSKAASDGNVQIACQRSGVVEAVGDGVITTGDLVVASRTTANRVESIATGGSLSLYQDLVRILGRALTTSANAGVVLIDLSLS